MSSLPKVAVAGAGSLGIPIILALLNSNKYAVTVLSRDPDAKSKYADKLPTSNPNLAFVGVDYMSVESLTNAIKDHYAVVSTLGTSAAGEQQPIIEASIAAGVQRFIPSEFGMDIHQPLTSKLPIFKYKIAIVKELEELAERNPSFTYTAVANGAFLDWGLEKAFMINPTGRSATIFNGGDVPFSTTTLATIAQAVVGVLNNLEATKNRTVKVHDTVITQNKLIEIAKKLDKENKPWNLTQADTQTTYNDSMKKLAGGKAEDIGPAMVGFLNVGLYGPEAYGSDFSKSGVDNELLGVPLMSEKEIEDVVARYL